MIWKILTGVIVVGFIGFIGFIFFKIIIRIKDKIIELRRKGQQSKNYGEKDNNQKTLNLKKIRKKQWNIVQIYLKRYNNLFKLNNVGEIKINSKGDLSFIYFKYGNLDFIDYFEINCYKKINRQYYIENRCKPLIAIEILHEIENFIERRKNEKTGRVSRYARIKEDWREDWQNEWTSKWEKEYHGLKGDYLCD